MTTLVMELKIKFQGKDLELIEKYKKSSDSNLVDEVVKNMMRLISECFELLDIDEDDTNADYDLKIDDDLTEMTLLAKNSEIVDLFNRMQYLLNKKYNG